MQPPDLSRRTIIAVVAIVAGVLVIVMALLGASGSSDETATASSPGDAIKPVEPLNPDDKDAGKSKKGGSTDRFDPSAFDPFAGSFGASGRRKVTVSVSGNGYVSIAVYYRDRKKPRVLHAPTFTETRKITGRFPLAAVVIQIPSFLGESAASRATCRIVIDGVEVSQESASGRWDIETCHA
jgi:hypothetical protein